MKYGVKLICYRGQAASEWQQIDMWLYKGNKRFETLDFEEASKLAEDYRTRNPGGIYDVKSIEED